MNPAKKDMFLALLRISMGFIFLWAFLDKLLGLGFATITEKSWLNGQSPTAGFLKFGTHGPFKSFFESLAGNSIVDYLFMFGLLGIGISLVLGIARKISTLSGTLMLFLMWLATFPPANNPFVDEHIIYIFVLIVFASFRVGRVWGLERWCARLPICARCPRVRNWLG